MTRESNDKTGQDDQLLHLLAQNTQPASTASEQEIMSTNSSIQHSTYPPINVVGSESKSPDNTKSLFTHFTSSDMSSVTSGHPLHRRKSYTSTWKDGWAPEFLVALFSMSCLVAIAAILLAMHNRPLSQWKLPIAPNALIAIFATISKSAMLLCIAEGLGQMKWIYFQRSRRKLHEFQVFDDASRGPWGALKLLSRVGPRATIASAGSILVLLSLAMDPFVQQILTYRTRMIVAQDIPATLATASAWDSGLYLDTSVTPTYGGASTSKMSMASNDLLNALARGVFALDSDTAYRCPTGNCTWSPFETLGVCSSCKTVTARQACSALECVYKSYSPDPFGSQERLFGFANSDFTCNSTTFANIAIVYHADNATSWNDEPAYNCTLSFCRKTYSASNFTLGNLNDDSTTTENLVPLAGANPPVGVNGSGLCSFRTESGASQNDKAGATFWINPSDVISMGNAMAPFFWTSLVTTLGANQFVASALSRQNEGNIPKTMEAVARSMTNQIRQGPNTTSVVGTSQVPEVYIHVAWRWLILPASLILLAVVFLTVVSRVESPVIWKSSTLATLFHSVHGFGTKEAGLASRGQMHDAAEESYALLRRDGTSNFALTYVDVCSAKDALPMTSLRSSTSNLGA